MAHGQYKIRGSLPQVMVAFQRNTLSVDEHTYRRMSYSPGFEALPWEEDYRARAAANSV